MNCDHHDATVVKVESIDPFLRRMKCNICGEFFVNWARLPREGKEVGRNFCVDCIHYRKGWFFQSDYCSHTANVSVDLVTGKKWIAHDTNFFRKNYCEGSLFISKKTYKQATAVRK
jgi:hypothetical protein